jgi:ribonucleotide reductase class II
MENKMDNINMNHPFDTMGLFTFLRTYARRHDENNPNSTVETWDQTITRVVESCNSQLHVGFTDQEKKELYNLLFNLKCSVAGRFLWQLGTNTVNKLGLPSLQNCSFVVVNEPVNPFTWAMNFLMLGAGVGYRILPEDLQNLPQVKYALVTRKDTKDADFVVPDSREGWIKLLAKTLKAHFYSGKNFTYSCVLLRSKGAPIKSFGGLASGPDVLCDGIDKINSVLNKRAGMNLRPIDALDIMNIIGMIVVSGNVRRSAQIALGSIHDKEYLQAKRWDLGNIPNWRAFSNNSVICDDVKDVLDNEDFWKGYDGTGEPYGLVNIKLSRACGRLGEFQYPDPEVDGYNPCLTGDTLIHTNEGLREINDLVGKPFTAIVNGKEYSSTEKGFWKTGTKPVFKMILENGLEIKTTDNHKFKSTEGWKEVKDLNCKDSLVLSENIKYKWNNNEDTFEDGYFIGQLIGNGTFNGDSPIIDMWIPNDIKIDNYKPAQIISEWSKKYKESIKFRECKVESDDYKKYRMTTVAFKTITDKYNVYPREKKVYEKGSFDFSKGLLQGFFDTDGCVQGNHEKGISIRLSQNNLERLKAVQRLLFAMGIYSTIYQNRRNEGVRELPDGQGSRKKYNCQAIHELVISKDSLFVFQEMIGFSDNNKSSKLTNLLSQYKRTPNKTKFVSKISSIESCGEEDVYDCTINEIHCFSANGIIAHNCAEISLANHQTCCLAELYLPNIKSYEELISCTTYLYRICKHSLSLPCADSKETEQIVHKQMRMGIGVTGYLQSTDEQRGWLKNCYEYLRKFDKDYSNLHGFPLSIKLTTVKPSGSLSILGNCTPGIHPGFSKYYKRRVRIASGSPLISLAKSHGYNVEYVQNFDGSLDYNTQIVTFPMSLPDHTIFAENCSALTQLEWVKKAQTEWSDNSVSVTVYYRKHELPQIKEWLKNNYNFSIKTVSFLLHNEHGFKQAPMEQITKEEYEMMASQCRPINDLSGVCFNQTDADVMENEKECAGGACPRK